MALRALQLPKVRGAVLEIAYFLLTLGKEMTLRALQFPKVWGEEKNSGFYVFLWINIDSYEYKT